MRDEVIRIILEAKDQLSGVVRNAQKNVDNSLGKIRNDLSRLDKEHNNFSRNWRTRLADEQGSVRIWGDAIEKRLRRVQNAFNRARRDLEKPIDFGKTERGASGRFESIAARRERERRGFGVAGGQIGPREATGGQILRQEIRDITRPIARPLGAFREGLRAAKETERTIDRTIAKGSQDFKQKSLRLEQDIAKEREVIFAFSNIVRDVTKQQIEAQRSDLKDTTERFKSDEAARELTRKEKIERKILNLTKEFDDKRADIEERRRTLIQRREQKFLDEQFSREKKLLKDIEEVRRSDSIVNKNEEIQRLRQIARQERFDAINERKADVRRIEQAAKNINKENLAARQVEVDKLEAGAARVRKFDSESVDRNIRKEEAATKARIDALDAQTSRDIRLRRQEFESSARERRLVLRGQSEGSIVGRALSERDLQLIKDAEKDTNRLSTAFRKAGTDFGDLVRGFRRGRGDFRTITDDARRMDSAFARFGQSIGRFTKNIGNLVNLRWYLIISAVQILGQLVLVLAANLISLASSAAIAASALGAGLVSAVAQALPAVGLLAAVMSRVKAAFTAAQQSSKSNAQSAQDARAQADAQRSAQQGLTDALYAQVQAVKSLADARRQAKRDIVDSINAEIDANYALKDAEFAVLDAKQRLRELEQQNQQDQQAVKDAQAQVEEAKQRLAAAKKEGDQAEIENAQIQLALAQQNLQDAKGQAAQQGNRKRQIDEQKLAVKEAEQQLREARIAQRRQEEDTARTVRLGVKGNQQVVDALHGVATANRDVANAQRAVTEASKKQASAGNLLQRQLSQLDPAERGLYNAFRRIRKVFHDTFRPITDIVVRAITGAVKRFTAVLRNPQISSAFTDLARSIAKGIGQLARFFSSRSFINSFVQFIHEAARNIPSIIKIIENLAKAFIGLAKAGEPVVKDILGRFVNLTGRFSRAVNAPVGGPESQVARGATGIVGARPQQTQAQKFIAGAKTYLDNWIKLAGAIGRVFKYLFLDAAPSGNSLVNALTRMFNNFADFLKDNPRKVNKFFHDMFEELKTLAGALFPVVKVLLSAFTGKNASEFAKFTAQVIVPGIALALQFLQLTAQALLAISHIPGAKLFLQLLFAEKLLNRIFPATQLVTNGLKKVGKVLFVEFFTGFSRTRGVMGRFVLYLRSTFAPAFTYALTFIKTFFKEMILGAARASKAFLEQMVKAVISGLTALVEFITTTMIPAIVAMGEALITFIADNPVVLAVAAIIIALVLLDRKFHFIMPAIRAVGDAFKEVWGWIRDHWKDILNWLIWPFKQYFNFYKFIFTKVKDIFVGVFNWFRDHWKDLLGYLEYPFVKVYDYIKSLPGKILGFFKNLFNDLKKLFHEIVHELTKLLHVHIHIKYALGFLPYPSISFGDNKDNSDVVKDKSSLSRKEFEKEQKQLQSGFNVGKKKKPTRRQEFAKGGIVQGKPGQAVHVVAHAGEWVLNKMQQSKAAHAAHETVGKLRRFLFGSDEDRHRRRKNNESTHHTRARLHHPDTHTKPTHGAYADGGKIRGLEGEAVPIIAHAGEWILNKAQQIKLAHRLRESTQQVAAMLFGDKRKKDNSKPSKPHHGPGSATPKSNVQGTGRQEHGQKTRRISSRFFPYNLVAKTDDDGNTVYFIEDTDEQFLEISGVDAKHMLRTAGKFIPKWIERHGYHLKRFKNAAAMAKGYAEGGIVGMNYTPSFAMGGVVNSPQEAYNASAITNTTGGNIHHKKIEQNFNVKTEGETDWNYVMRLAALHAQGSF